MEFKIMSLPLLSLKHSTLCPRGQRHGSHKRGQVDTEEGRGTLDCPEQLAITL